MVVALVCQGVAQKVPADGGECRAQRKRLTQIATIDTLLSGCYDGWTPMGELLYMNKGKGDDSVKPFFEQMTPEQRKNIEIACMDRNASYSKAVKEFCPNAEIN